MLRVTLLGNLGADPETRFSAKGTQITQFRVAINMVRTGPEGERQENTEWFRVRVSGPRSEFAKTLGKGNRVLVVGRLDIGHYQSRDGETRTSYDVWADELQSMSARGFAPEPDAGSYEADTDQAEPALAGASSVARPQANGRPRPTRQDATTPTNGAAAEELEDLPF